MEATEQCGSSISNVSRRAAYIQNLQMEVQAKRNLVLDDIDQATCLLIKANIKTSELLLFKPYQPPVLICNRWINWCLVAFFVHLVILFNFEEVVRLWKQ